MCTWKEALSLALDYIEWQWVFYGEKLKATVYKLNGSWTWSTYPYNGEINETW